MSKESTRKSYYPALDSIRLFAMLAILIYHYAPHQLSGGFIGVDLFMVISGFLMVSSLMKWDTKKFGPTYLGFLAKRVVRLGLPVVIVFLAAVSVINLFFSDLLYNIRGALLSSMAFVNNWWQIQLGFSYFEQYVHPSAFTHLWYVSVLMQLCVIWPLLIILMRKRRMHPMTIALVQLVLAVASAIAMGVLYGGGDPSRVYYGTDTRLYAYALGGALGAMWRPSSIAKHNGRKSGVVADVFALASLALLVLLALKIQDQAAITYRGGMFAAAVVSTIAVAALSMPNSLVARLLSAKPLVFAGKCTFSCYLWYYPVLTMGGMNAFLSANKWVQWIILAALSVFTYLVIEQGLVAAITKGQFASLSERVKSVIGSVATNKASFFAVVFVAMLCVSSGFGFARAESGDNTTVTEMQAQIAENEKILAKQKALQARNEKAAIADIDYLTRSVMLYCHDLKVTFIGDSILLGAAAPLAETFPMSTIDGKVGRQLSQSAGIVQSLSDQGNLNDIVVLVLGSNGPFTEDQLDELINLIGKDRKIYLVNTKVPREWQDNVNAMLAERANKSKKDNVKLIDWKTFIEQYPDLLYEDGTHPTPDGSKSFTKLIADTLYNDLASDEQKESDRLADEEAAAQAAAQAEADADAADTSADTADTATE